MEYKVELTKTAQSDLFDIYFFVALNDSFNKADKLIKRLKDKCKTLHKFPKRGSKINELYEERPDLMQVICSPYNIIYKVENNKVFILAILDGRRNLQQELQDRILR